MPDPISIYFHVPFCKKICSYCVFNTYAGMDALIPRFVDALTREIQVVGNLSGGLPVHTVYFGGGTPSVLSVEQIERILGAAAAAFRVADSLEVTLEANPSDVDEGYLCGLRQAGVNRLSFGAQSAQQSELELFRRDHDWARVEHSFGAARAAGFDDISLDLIYGIPNQMLSQWRETLEKSLALAPDHFSMYSLTVEPGSALHVWVEKGRVAEPDPDRAADMYDLATELLAEAGYVQYEISSWCMPGKPSRHNLQYWRNLPYLGFGPGAHGYSAGIRYETILAPRRYIDSLIELPQDVDLGFPLSPAANLETVEQIDDERRRSEMMMLGLRLLDEGISTTAFERAFSHPIEHFYGSEIKKLAELDLLEVRPDRILLTPRARLIGNYVFRHFV